jgi:hypothetical protein
MDDDDDHYAPRGDAAPKEGDEDDPLQSMDESGRGPRRAEAIARPLLVQPSMDSTECSSSKRPVARV